MFIFVSPVYADNLVKNSGFEDGVSNWEEQGASAVSVSDEKKSGDKAILISNNQKTSYGVQQLITGIESGQNYLLEGWAKAKDLARATGVRLRIGWYESEDGSGDQMSPQDTNQVETGEWSYLRSELKAPDKAKSARIRLVLSTKEDGQAAEAYFDDIYLDRYEVSPTPSPTMTPAPTSEPTPTEAERVTTLTPVKKPTLVVTRGVTESPEQTNVDELRKQILGSQTEDDKVKGNQISMSSENNSKKDFLAMGLIGGGGGLLTMASIPMFKRWRSKSRSGKIKRL